MYSGIITLYLVIFNIERMAIQQTESFMVNYDKICVYVQQKKKEYTSLTIDFLLKQADRFPFLV